MQERAAVLFPMVLLAACSTAGSHTPYFLTPAEVGAVRGTYNLSNGDILRISSEQRRYWAEMKSTGRIEIIPVDSMVFVAKDGSTRFTFTPVPFTTDVRIEFAAGRPAAARGG